MFEEYITFFFSFSLQLLNQLESSGAPPASAEKIDALPIVSVSQEQVGKCTVNQKTD